MIILYKNITTVFNYQSNEHYSEHI